MSWHTWFAMWFGVHTPVIQLGFMCAHLISGIDYSGMEVMTDLSWRHVVTYLPKQSTNPTSVLTYVLSCMLTCVAYVDVTVVCVMLLADMFADICLCVLDGIFPAICCVARMNPLLLTLNTSSDVCPDIPFCTSWHILWHTLTHVLTYMDCIWVHVSGHVFWLWFGHMLWHERYLVEQSHNRRLAMYTDEFKVTVMGCGYNWRNIWKTLRSSACWWFCFAIWSMKYWLMVDCSRS